MSEHYQHSSLATESTIRLIKLEAGKVEGQIACTIRHAEQSTAHYDALSYVWGDPTPTRQILIRNNAAQPWDSFRLHENLWQFLNNIWQRQIFDRWLWTDCIYLNQTDDKELREQIPRMTRIYHNTVRVVSWLGLSASQGEHLLPVQLFMRTNPEWKRARRVSPAVRKFPAETALAGTALLDAEYWQRVWIVQEVAAAKKVICFVGNTELSFDDVKRMTFFRCSVTGEPGRYPGWFSMRCLRDSSRLSSSSEGGGHPTVDLWKLLVDVTYQSFKSQRPHDGIYGILGMAATLSDGTSPLEQIKVNYDKPPAHVFLDAILESHPQWTKYTGCYQKAINLLLKNRNGTTANWEPIFTLLTGYTESSLTSQRHKELGKLVISVSDALYSISTTAFFPLGSHGTHETFRKLLHSLSTRFHSERLERTAQHSAVMLGVALAMVSNKDSYRRRMAEDWKACRQPIVAAGSPWKCDHLDRPTESSVTSRSPFSLLNRPLESGESLQLRMTKQMEWEAARKEGEFARRYCDTCPREVHCSENLESLLMWKKPVGETCNQCEDIQSSGSPRRWGMLCDFPEAKFRLRLSHEQCSARDGLWHNSEMHMTFRPPEPDEEHICRSCSS